MNIIEKLLASSGTISQPFPLSEFEVIQLCLQVRQVFLRQPMLLELSVPINICGDVHGQHDELCRIFELGGMPSTMPYLFLGDYVDRGKKQLETICLLFACKVKYPLTFHLLRGNHECIEVCSQYGFLDECQRVLNRNIFDHFIAVFDVMPVAAIVEQKMFCAHGGISPELQSMDQIRNLPRPTNVPESGLLCDLLWSDPDIMTQSWCFNYSRGTSFKFGVQDVVEFLKRFQLDIIVRAHEVVPEGYQFFAGLKLLTLFSSTNFGTNHAMFMSVNEALHCTFHRID